MQPRTYLLLFLAAAAALVGAVVAINARVDPYGLAGGARFADDTGVAESARPGVFWRKALTGREAMPRTVILGTSRAEFGLDARHPAFGPARAPALNLALGGLSIDQMRLLLIHANAQSTVRMAILGLDLESFLDDGRTDFDPAALRGNPESEPESLVRLRLDVSREALSASVARLKDTEVAGAAPESRGRTVEPQAWRISDEALKGWDGQRGIIWVGEYGNFYARLPLLFPQGPSAARWAADRKRAAAMQQFRELLRYARDHDIELRMFISPVHARYLEWYQRVGWWPLFEAWKRALVDAIDADAKAATGRAPYALWDFGEFHSMATEPVPQLGDHSTRMRWYRDTSHYMPELGNLVLARVLGDPGAAPSPLPDARLDRGTIDRHLAGIRSGAVQYRLAQPQEAADLNDMLAYLRRASRK